MDFAVITQDFKILACSSAVPLHYRGFLFPPNHGKWHSTTLLLTGTSTEVFDVKYFIDKLLERGCALAAIERFIGGPLAFFVRPDMERPAALKHFMDHLYNDVGVKSVNVVAHSYAAQEVVRAFDGRPADSLPRIGMISFINPSGFGNTGGFFPHCLRFVFLFVLWDYYCNLKRFVTHRDAPPEMKADYRRRMQGILVLFIKTISNPVRTFKEVADIVTCDLRPAVRRLVNQGGWRLQVFLSKEDTLVSNDRTRNFFRNELPSVRCIELPGNHLDPLLCESCVQTVLNALKAE